MFVHSARTPADIIFRAELAQLQASHDGFRVVAVCEQDSDVEAWHRTTWATEPPAAP